MTAQNIVIKPAIGMLSPDQYWTVVPATRISRGRTIAHSGHGRGRQLPSADNLGQRGWAGGPG